MVILSFAMIVNGLSASTNVKKWPSSPVQVEYILPGSSISQGVPIPVFNVINSSNTRVTTYRNTEYQVVLHEINRGNYTELNGEIEYLVKGTSCVTLRISVPLSGQKWKWFHGLDKSKDMKTGNMYYDTIPVHTTIPPDGAFNGKTLADGGYGDPVGRGTMSFYPLSAVNVDNEGMGMGIDLSIPLVYRLGAEINKGLIAEFDVATSPMTEKFPNRAFFKLCTFSFDAKWGMRSALEEYYSIFPKD